MLARGHAFSERPQHPLRRERRRTRGIGRIGMKLRSVGYGERPIEVSAARLTTSGSRIEYRRSLVGNDGAEWPLSRKFGCDPVGIACTVVRAGRGGVARGQQHGRACAARCLARGG